MFNCPIIQISLVEGGWYNKNNQIYGKGCVHIIAEINEAFIPDIIYSKSWTNILLSLLIEYLCLQKYVYKASLTNMHVANNT